MVKNLCFVVAVLNAMDYLNNYILLFSYKEDKSVLSVKHENLQFYEEIGNSN